MRRYVLLIICLIIVAAACVIASADVIPPDPLAGGSTIVGEDYTPDYSEPVDNDYFSGTLKSSSSCIEMLKALEGYLAKPKGDYGQMSVGYGCNTNYLRKYREQLDISEEDFEKVISSDHTNYILKEEKAEALMMYVLVEIEETLDKFLDKYNITLNQYQYDSLVSFTYNLGSGWMSPSSTLGELLIEGDYTVNEFACAMGAYCHVKIAENKYEIIDILVTRRIREIKLFLYGAYELDDTPIKFCTLRYDAGDGDAITDIGFYQVDQPYQILLDATPEEASGEFFIGWYTADGEKITASDIAESSKAVSARYSVIPEDPEISQDGIAYVPGDNPSIGETDYTNTWTPVDITTVFSDMDYNDWHYDYVCELYSRGVIDGFPDLTFRPENTVTTGQALKMILLAAGYEEPEKVASHWARNFMNLALEEGIIDRGDITDLDVPISRGLMAKIVVNAMKLSRLYDHFPFTDTTDGFVLTMYDFGLADGYPDGSFLPNNHLKRSELSAIVCRMYDVKELYNLN